jgi:hypothetical protein
MVAQNSSTWEIKAGGLRIEGHPGLHKEFQVSLSCIVRREGGKGGEGRAGDQSGKEGQKT